MGEEWKRDVSSGFLAHPMECQGHSQDMEDTFDGNKKASCYCRVENIKLVVLLQQLGGQGCALSRQARGSRRGSFCAHSELKAGPMRQHTEEPRTRQQPVR